MKLTIVGDTVVQYPLASRSKAGDGPGDSALSLLGRTDITVGNLEVPLTSRGFPAEKVVAMRAPESAAQVLFEMGFDAMSLATNHALDWGIEGITDTLDALDRAGVRHFGAGENLNDATTPTYLVTESGEEVALLNFCCTLPPGYNATSERPGVAAIRIRQTFEYDGVLMEEQPGTPPFVYTWAHEPDVLYAIEAIRAAKSRCAHVVVALHWGVPWCYVPDTQGTLAQYQRPLAHRLADAGANLIIGHHPHCLHPIEIYRNTMILYSVGNFVFQWDVSIEGDGTRPTSPLKPALVTGPWYDSAVFEVTLDGDVPELQVHPIALDSRNEPLIPTGERAARIIGDLETMCRELDDSVRFTTDGHFICTGATAARVDAG